MLVLLRSGIGESDVKEWSQGKKKYVVLIFVFLFSTTQSSSYIVISICNQLIFSPVQSRFHMAIIGKPFPFLYFNLWTFSFSSFLISSLNAAEEWSGSLAVSQGLPSTINDSKIYSGQKVFHRILLPNSSCGSGNIWRWNESLMQT